MAPIPSCARGEQSEERDEAKPGPRRVTDRPCEPEGFIYPETAIYVPLA